MRGAPKFFAGCRTLQEGEKRYKELMLKHHPDRKGGSTEMTHQIHEEWELVRYALEHFGGPIAAVSTAVATPKRKKNVETGRATVQLSPSKPARRKRGTPQQRIEQAVTDAAVELAKDGIRGLANLIREAFK